LSGAGVREDESLTAKLIADIHAVFEEAGEHGMKTTDLIDHLSRIEESPWGDWRGKPITAHALSRLLKPYRIKTMSVWVDGETVRGYKPSQFIDAFHRVVGVRSVRAVRDEANNKEAPNAANAPNASLAMAGAPGLGEPGYPMRVDKAFASGHTTEGELRQLLKVDRAIRRINTHRQPTNKSPTPSKHPPAWPKPSSSQQQARRHEPSRLPSASPS
jgi:hypothetical protein